MEDNIGDMMIEIRDVVSNHLSDVQNNLQKTMDVINTLPLVVSLKNQIRKLENENKQLKMLIDSVGEEKNIELEIVEVPKQHPSVGEEDKSEEESVQIDDAEEDSGDEETSDSNLDGDFGDEEELGIVVDHKNVNRKGKLKLIMYPVIYKIEWGFFPNII